MVRRPMAIAEDNCEHVTVVGFGGMCFLELDLFKRAGITGPWGLFSNVFTTPAAVAAILDNDFQDFPRLHVLYHSLNI